jgi:hypothetical protein
VGQDGAGAESIRDPYGMAAPLTAWALCCAATHLLTLDQMTSYGSVLNFLNLCNVYYTAVCVVRKQGVLIDNSDC